MKQSCKSQAKVLEIGCGPTGQWLKFLKEKSDADVYGIDYSKIGALRTKENISEVHVIVADARKPPIKEDTFELVFSLGVIEHYLTPNDLVKKHVQLTKSKGMAIISIPNFYPSHLGGILARCRGSYEKIRRTHNLGIMRSGSLLVLCRSLGEENTAHARPIGIINLFPLSNRNFKLILESLENVWRTLLRVMPQEFRCKNFVLIIRKNVAS